MKKWYRIVIITISIVIGFCFTVWKLNSPSVKLAFYDKVTQEDYMYLKECANKVANTLNTNIQEEDVRVNKDFDNKNLYITCELIQLDMVKCKLSAQYPIIFDNKMLIENDKIQLNGKIDFKAVTYTEEEIMKPLASQIVIIILSSCLISIVINVLFYYTPKELKESLAWQQEQQKQKEQEK